MKTGIELIAEERERQIHQEGWGASHDSEHTGEELATAGALYAMPAKFRQLDNSFVGVPIRWPWQRIWWKPSPENRVKELVKAGALIAAEIDRIQKL